MCCSDRFLVPLHYIIMYIQVSLSSPYPSIAILLLNELKYIEHPYYIGKWRLNLLLNENNF